VIENTAMASPAAIAGHLWHRCSKATATVSDVRRVRERSHMRWFMAARVRAGGRCVGGQGGIHQWIHQCTRLGRVRRLSGARLRIAADVAAREGVRGHRRIEKFRPRERGLHRAGVSDGVRAREIERRLAGLRAAGTMGRESVADPCSQV